EATREQMRALIDAGVDSLVFETHRPHEARVRLQRLRGLTMPPLLISLSAWPGAESPRQQRVLHSRVYPLIGREHNVSAFGSNCVVGMEETLRITKRLRGRVDVPLIARPSAGLPGGPLERP